MHDLIFEHYFSVCTIVPFWTQEFGLINPSQILSVFFLESDLFGAWDHVVATPKCSVPATERILAGQSRFPPARSREEDNSSVLSWNTAQNESDDPADGEDPLLVNEGMVSMGINRLDPISEAPGASQSATTAPALQAARNFVDHTNETPVDRKLRKQQEQAHRRGKKGLRWVQLGAHNAINVELPNHIQQVGSGTGERSILILDHRDQRLQSPFQGWLVDEILTNAHSKIHQHLAGCQLGALANQWVPL